MLTFVLAAIVGGLIWKVIPKLVSDAFEILTEETSRRAGYAGPLPTKEEIIEIDSTLSRTL